MKIKKLDYYIEENLIDLIDKRAKPLILWNILYVLYTYFYYDIPSFFKRMTCHIKGCKVKGGWGGFNLPPEAYAYYCSRCGAEESNYTNETRHKIIEVDESILWKIEYRITGYFQSQIKKLFKR